MNYDPYTGKPLNGAPGNDPNGKSGEGMAIASVVLGIASILLFGLPFVNLITLIGAVIGIVLAVTGRRRMKIRNSSTAAATAGLILSIIGAMFSLMSVGCYACIFIIGESASHTYDYYGYYFQLMNRMLLCPGGMTPFPVGG